MIPNELKTIIETLSKQGKMSFIAGATEKEISDFEKSHSIVLPVKYKVWLQYSDGGEWFLPAGVQFHGVAHAPIINVNDDDRPADNYVVIGTLSTGDPILCEKDSEQISIYNHDAGKIEEDEIYQDLYSFLRDLPAMLGIEE